MANKALLMTGGGGFIGRYVLEHFLGEPEFGIFLVEQGRFIERLRAFLEANAPEALSSNRVRIVEGDITRAGLGLSRDVLDEMRGRVTHILHLAALYNLAIPRDVAVRVNVEGTRNLLDLAVSMKNLERFGHVSTLAVAGNHRGVFSEDDLDMGQTFKNFYEETKYLSEKLVREYADRLPTTILRPAVVVGHTQTGAIEKIDGPYYVFVMIRRHLHALVPDCGATLCHVAPVDFIADALFALLRDDAALGKTYLLVDPNPITYNALFDLVCRDWGSFKMPPLVRVPPSFMLPIARFRWFEQLTGIPYEAFVYGDQPIEYAAPRTTETLARHGIACPPLPSYLPVLIRFFREHYRDPAIRRGDWRQGTT